MRNFFMAFADSTEMRPDHADAPAADTVVRLVWGARPRPRPFAATLSWLKDCFIQGMAAYGETMFPSLIDPPHPQADDEQSGSVAPWPSCRRPNPEAAPDDNASRGTNLPPYRRDDIDRYLERYSDHGGW